MKTKQTQTTANDVEPRKRVRVGRPPLFETADDLWAKAIEYFEYCDKHPLKVDVKTKLKRGRDESAEQGQQTVSRPYTLDGLCLYCNILMPWATFKQHCNRRADSEAFGIVINACEATVRDQQVTGAMIGAYSERLTARLNGITERQELEVNQRQTTISFDDYVKMLNGEKV